MRNKKIKTICISCSLALTMMGRERNENKKIKTICISCSLTLLTMMLTACGSGKPSVPGTTGNNPATIISTEELSKKELDKINERIEKVGKSYDGLYDYNYGYDLFGAKGMNSGSVGVRNNRGGFAMKSQMPRRPQAPHIQERKP